MKKIVTLVLAIALLLTSVSALAAGTPNINTFATMTTKNKEADGVITITLSKPVDKLVVFWAEKGAEAEELAVDENLKATALTWGHKYMPGTEQKYGTKGVTDTVEKKWLKDKYNAETSEWTYAKGSVKTSGERNGVVDYVDTVTKEEKWDVRAFEYTENGVKKVGYEVYGYDEDGEAWFFDAKSMDVVKWVYENEFPGLTYEVVEPKAVTVKKDAVNVWGEKVKVDVTLTNWALDDYLFAPFTYTLYNDGSIQGTSFKREFNPKAETVIATPAQAAYGTKQGEWAVYYNRAGKIVGIEPYEGQF